MTVSLSKDPLDEKTHTARATAAPEEVDDVPAARPVPDSMSNGDSDDWDLVIKPRRGWIGLNWKELLSHRELLLFLVWRDVKVKYKQAVLGFAWAIIVPVISVILFTVIGRAAGWQSKFNGPYPVYVYAGLLPWLFLATSINNGGMSLVNQQSL